MSFPARLLRPVLPEGVRQAFFRARLRARGRRVKFGARSRIDSYCDLASDVTLNAGASVFGSRAGKWTYFGEHSLVIYSDIGAFCSIAPHVIIGGGRHPTDFVSTSPVFYGAVHNPWGAPSGMLHRAEELPKTHVGNDVWIGYSAVVLPGVCVGDGAVIGAGAVVTRDVEPYAVVAGVPARTIRSRFDRGHVEWLLERKWWNWPDERLKALRPQFASVAALRAALEPETEPVASGTLP